MKQYLLFIIICVSRIFADLIHPHDGSELSYIHVLFEWDADVDATEYTFQLSESENFSSPLVEFITTQLYYIEEEKIEWESAYYWRVCPIPGECLNPYNFSTGSTLSDATSIIHDESQYASGLTICSTFEDSYTIVIDHEGKEIWNSGGQNIIFYNYSPNGQLFGAQYIAENLDGNYLPGVEFSFNDSIIWEEPNTEFVHHEFIQLPWGNYMGIAQKEELGPIPLHDLTSLYQSVGYIADGETNEFPWQGDQIIEWDNETKEIVWSWSAFDNYSMEDFDSLLWNSPTYNHGFFEWTHLNALFFDETDSSIYISSRHLSRITKIDYSSRNIIWNMGHEMASGEVDFGHDLGFSYQHSLDILDNGNIVFLDNGNRSYLYLDTYTTLSRALEIAITQQEEQYDANIVWDYVLPADLYGYASGNVQKLDNNNYLITTVANNGTSLEVTSDHEIIWEANYNSPLIYRAQRIPGLYKEYYTMEVYPGDTDNNGIVDEYDILPIGVYFLQEGNSRQNTQFSWGNMYAQQWDVVPATFADANGDGIVNGRDVIGIGINWGNTHEIEGLDFTINLSEEDLTPEQINSFLSIYNSLEGNSTPIIEMKRVIGELLNINIPSTISLYQNYPNPLNPKTTISFELDESRFITITIYNLLGQEVIKLADNKFYEEGFHSVVFAGDELASGTYIYQLNTMGHIINKQMIILK